MYGPDPVADACHLLMRHAGADTWPVTLTGQRQVLRRARGAVHPDRGLGREEWDTVEEAAALLGLTRPQVRR